MNQIALASGFGSVRRFNAGIMKVYRRTPTQIRHVSRQKEIQPENQYLFRLNFRPPYHWQGMLDFLIPRCTSGVEFVEGHCYRRTISLNGQNGWFEVSLDQDTHILITRIEFGDPQALFVIVERIRAMFDLNADWTSISESLKSDPILAEMLRTEPGIRIPGGWDGFELATRAILGQQVSVKAATTLAGRLVTRFGEPFRGRSGLTHTFPKAEVLAEAKIASIGLTGARAHTIQALARAVRDGKITFTGILDSETFLARLCEIPGIGMWTGQYVAMRALGQPDAFPSTDLGLLRATSVQNARELDRRSASWRPWRAYAAMYLWRFFAREVSDRKKRDSFEAQQRTGGEGSPHDYLSLA